jgi:hypothetical protein
MKSGGLLRHLRQNGCELLREGVIRGGTIPARTNTHLSPAITRLSIKSPSLALVFSDSTLENTVRLQQEALVDRYFLQTFTQKRDRVTLHTRRSTLWIRTGL